LSFLDFIGKVKYLNYMLFSKNRKITKVGVQRLHK